MQRPHMWILPSWAPEKRCIPCRERWRAVTGVVWPRQSALALGISPGATVVGYTAMLPPLEAAQHVVSGPPSGCRDTTCTTSAALSSAC